MNTTLHELSPDAPSTRFREIPMKKILSLIAVMCSLMAPQGSVALDEHVGADAVNEFAIDLYRQFRTAEGNLFFSPYSVYVTVAMVGSGARGETQSQIAKVLHFGGETDKANDALRIVSEQIASTAQSKDVELNTANALWVEKTYPILQTFLESIRTDYQGELRQLDFLHAPDSARNTINTWVEKQTKNKIKDLIPADVITVMTRLVLTNAIYFNGKWQAPFDRELTWQVPFTLLDGTDVNVPTMKQTANFGYLEEPGLQVLDMPYKGRELSMTVFLPSKKRRLEDFERSLKHEDLNRWLKSLKIRLVEVHLPRLTMTSTHELRSPLSVLGMIDAFSPTKADFSGMTGRRGLFISQGIHKAFVQVDEKGTEAAAATAIFKDLALAPPRPPCPVFRADHPFLFLIRHTQSNCILFMGRVTRP